MDRYLENIEHKAAVLCDALPYIRDFVNKIIVVEYDCGEWLSGVEEKKLMKDIVLLKSIGVIPIVVHRTPMGVDKFRENKIQEQPAAERENQQIQKHGIKRYFVIEPGSHWQKP